MSLILHTAVISRWLPSHRRRWVCRGWGKDTFPAGRVGPAAVILRESPVGPAPRPVWSSAVSEAAQRAVAALPEAGSRRGVERLPGAAGEGRVERSQRPQGAVVERGARLTRSPGAGTARRPRVLPLPLRLIVEDFPVLQLALLFRRRAARAHLHYWHLLTTGRVYLRSMPICNIQQLASHKAASNARISSFQCNITLISAAPAPSIARLRHLSLLLLLRVSRDFTHFPNQIIPHIHVDTTPCCSVHNRVYTLSVYKSNKYCFSHIHIDTTARVYTLSVYKSNKYCFSIHSLSCNANETLSKTNIIFRGSVLLLLSKITQTSCRYIKLNINVRWKKNIA